MDNIHEIINAMSSITFVITIAATVVVRVTPTKSDDEAMDDILKKVHSIMSMFPTWGVNPKTKELEKEVKAIEGENGFNNPK